VHEEIVRLQEAKVLFQLVLVDPMDYHVATKILINIHLPEKSTVYKIRSWCTQKKKKKKKKNSKRVF